MKVVMLRVVVALFATALVACSQGMRGETMQNEALSAIKKSYGTDEQEYGVNLFVQHHIAELTPEQWLESLGDSEPGPKKILDSLVLAKKWESDGEFIFDYSLPGNVTDYVLAVTMDEEGRVISIEMEG